MMTMEPTKVATEGVAETRATDDAEALRAWAQQADERAFAAVVRRHVDMVYSVCRRECGDAHLAEDATQAVFILLAERASKIQGRRVAGWLYEAAWNCSRNARRGERRRVRREAGAARRRVDLMEQAGVERGIVQEELAQAVQGSMARLGKGEREVLVLRYFARMTVGEVGRALGVSEDAAKQRVSRAIGKLRQIMGTSGSGAEAWLGSAMVVSAAPKGVAEGTVAAVAGGTHSTAAMGIARGVTMAARMKMAGAMMGAIIVTAVIGGSVVALKGGDGAKTPVAVAAAPAPVKSQPVVTPAAIGVKVGSAEELAQRKTPTGCLQAMARRERAGDIDGVRACIHEDASETSKALRMAAGVEIGMVQYRMIAAEKKAFGPEVKPFRFTAATIAELAEVVSLVSVTQEGDRATAQVPGLGFGVWFIREADGGWTFDGDKSLRFVMQKGSDKWMPATATELEAFWKTVVAVGNQVTAEVERGEIASEQLVGQRFDLVMRGEMQKRNMGVTGVTVKPVEKKEG